MKIVLSSQRQQAEDLYRKARETNDPDLEVKSVELLNKVSLEEERVRLAKVQLESQQQQTFYKFTNTKCTKCATRSV
jgi:hypothetical protein